MRRDTRSAHERDGRAASADAAQRRAYEARVALWAADLRRRLQPVCCEWTRAEFEDIVQRIARMKVRWSDLERAD